MFAIENLIRGLDDDEVQFLELVDKNKMDMEKKQMLEEEQELKDFRSRVATLQEESVDKVTKKINQCFYWLLIMVCGITSKNLCKQKNC